MSIASALTMAVYKEFGLPQGVLRSKSRQHEIAQARAILCRLLRDRLGWPYSAIGTYLNRNWNTARHACVAQRSAFPDLENKIREEFDLPPNHVEGDRSSEALIAEETPPRAVSRDGASVHSPQPR